MGSRNKIELLILCLSYGFFALCRKAVSTTLPWMTNDLDLEKQDMGLIASAFAAGYGFSKFFGSVACDYFPPRALLGFGLALAASSALAFAFIPSMEFMIFCWILQGIAQGIAWPSISCIICSNFDPSYRGTIWSTVSSVRKQTLCSCLHCVH